MNRKIFYIIFLLLTAVLVTLKTNGQNLKGEDFDSFEAYKIRGTSDGKMELLVKVKFKVGTVFYYKEREGESNPIGFGDDPLGCYVKESDFEAQKIDQDTWSYRVLRSGAEMCGIILHYDSKLIQVKIFPKATN